MWPHRDRGSSNRAIVREPSRGVSDDPPRSAAIVDSAFWFDRPRSRLSVEGSQRIRGIMCRETRRARSLDDSPRAPLESLPLGAECDDPDPSSEQNVGSGENNDVPAPDHRGEDPDNQQQSGEDQSREVSKISARSLVLLLAN